MAETTQTRRTSLPAGTLYRLSNLLDCVPPEELREHLLELYHQYIIHEHESLPNNFSNMAEGMQMLFDLLKFLGEKRSTR
jgi:hypothetical protein